MRLTYPCGIAPGFNPSHPAALGVRQSAVTLTGANFVSLLTGTKGTLSGTVTPNTHAVIGPNSAFALSAYVTFPNGPTTVDSNFTGAGICYLTTGAATAALFCSDNQSTDGCSVSINASNILGAVYTGVNRISSATTLSTGVPYFIAASRTQSTGNFVVVDLRTGLTFSSVTTGGTGTPIAGGGTFQIANASTAQTWIGGIACVMYSNQFTPLAVLQQWAADPWSFWYNV